MEDLATQAVENLTQVVANLTQNDEVNSTLEYAEVAEVAKVVEEESGSSFFWTLVKIIIAIIIILLISCCGLGTAVPSEQKERQIRFAYLTGKKQYAKKDERVKSEVQIFDDSNQLVVPGGHLDVVYIGPDGAVRPASAVHSSTNSLIVTFDAPQDGDYTIRVYYDGVLVNDDRTYPYNGLVNKESPTQTAEGEKSDSESRVPVPTEETKTRDLTPPPAPEPEPEPEPIPVPEPVREPEPIPEPEPAPEPEPEAPEPLIESSEEDKTSDASEDEKEVKHEGEPTKKVKKGGFFKGLFHSDKAAGGVAKQGGLQVHVDYPQKMVPLDRELMIMVRLEDLDKKEFVDEPNVSIYAEIIGPKKKTINLDAEKVDEVGSWKIIFKPSEAGKYKSKVFVNKQDAQKKWSTINVGSTMHSVAENLPIPTIHLGKKKDK